MAGDWIKFEHATPDKPEVYRIAEILGIDPDAVVGKLLRFWIWADQQSVSGDNLPITESVIDRLTHQPGFSAALRKVGWLQARSGSLEVPRFDRHNGQSAKARAESNRRMAKSRKVRKEKASAVDVAEKAQQNAQPEKRREEKNERERTRALAAAVPEIPNEIIAGVNGLRADWSAAPGWTSNERHMAADSLEALASISSESWDIVRRYLAARLPEGDPGWQPRSRLKLLEAPADVLAHAMAWHRKQPSRPTAKHLPPPSPAEPPLDREEIRAALRIVG